MRPPLEDWCSFECHDNGMTNKEIVDKFVNKYLAWLHSKEEKVGCETRSLRLKTNQMRARKDITKLIYELSN